MQVPNVTKKQRDVHLDWLKEITAIPTAAGREDRVIAWIEAWVAHRPGLSISRDKAGNLLISKATTLTDSKATRSRPLYITAHLDHPAFIVQSVRNDIIELEFRGGVNDPYFESATIEIIDSENHSHAATIDKLNNKATPFKRVTARLKRSRKGIVPGDIARWKLPKPSINAAGELHTNACDDLAAVAAALAVIDITYKRAGLEHVSLLFTRAEEVGFVGAIAACRLRSIPKTARLICLENSRSFAESPIGGGPILRVGDRISVFEPNLTNALCALLLEYAGKNPSFKWQRKLMPGGACEATAFASFGYDSTCVCLPLGSYHNMRDIDAVAQGKRPARIGREYISIADFHGLVDLLLISCAKLDDERETIRQRMDRFFEQRAGIVGL
ncbi:MAG: hypothetical protein ACR2GY_12370 [Phycisphaerales bacterium]